MTSSPYDADAGYLLQQLDWKDLSTQCQIQVASMVFKALDDLVPDYLSSMFSEPCIRQAMFYGTLQTNQISLYQEPTT